MGNLRLRREIPRQRICDEIADPLGSADRIIILSRGAACCTPTPKYIIMKLKNILVLDTQLTKKMRIAENPGKLRTIAALFAHSGDSWLWAVGLLTLWLFGNTFWKEWAMVQLGALTIMAVFVLILKFSFKRKRPEGEWGEMYRSTDPHSFPSGHATRSFLLGTMGIFLGPPWMAIVLVILAPLVALGRVAMGVHYLSDIAVGALLGIIGGWIGFAIYPIIYAWFLGWSGWVLW